MWLSFQEEIVFGVYLGLQILSIRELIHKKIKGVVVKLKQE